jgi:hypothetical protein
VTELDVGLTGSGINASLIICKDTSTAGGEEAVGVSGHAFSGRGSLISREDPDSAVSAERRCGSSRIDVSDMSKRGSSICNRLR